MGFTIPDDPNDNRGKVINISTDCMKFTEGDTILYGKYSGTKIKMEDKEYIIMKEEDILAIVHHND
jgi:chaperonin GroES